MRAQTPIIKDAVTVDAPEKISVVSGLITIWPSDGDSVKNVLYVETV